MEVARTERLRLRWLDARDAPFVLELVNDPAWIRYIGDRNVRTLRDAERYIDDGPVAMYARTGFGLYLVESRRTGEPVGLCGLIKRDSLEDVDLGFALLPGHRGKGYALESAAAVMAYARAVVGLSRIVAILSRDNERSRRLLEKLGFEREREIRLHADGEPLELYAAAA